jgi:hypothetical protein
LGNLVCRCNADANYLLSIGFQCTGHPFHDPIHFADPCDDADSCYSTESCARASADDASHIPAPAPASASSDDAHHLTDDHDHCTKYGWGFLLTTVDPRIARRAP